MTETTDNHDWTMPTPGSTDDWGTVLNSLIDDDLDDLVPVYDTKSNRPAAEDGNPVLYVATDENILYYNDGATWNVVAGVGTASQRVPGTAYRKKLDVQDLTLRGTALDDDDDGQIENAAVDALANFDAGEAFSGYPIKAGDIADGVGADDVRNVTTVTASESPYTTSGEDVVLVDSSTGTVTVTLATPSSTPREVKVVDIGGSAAANPITVDTEGTETLEPGAAGSKQIDTDDANVTFEWDGSQWVSDLVGHYESLSAEEASVTNESFVRATRGTASSTFSSGTFVNAFDGESKDNRSEFNSSQQFVPDKSGEYFVAVTAQFKGGASGDGVGARVQNTTTGTPAQGDERQKLDVDKAKHGWSWVVNLSAGDAYEVQVTNHDSSFSVGSAGTQGEIVWSVVQ